MAIVTFAPGDSKWSWEIEQQWCQPRSKSLVKAFGRNSVKDPSKPFAEFENTEAALQHISDAAMHEFAALLTTCQTGGKPWRVSAPGKEQNIVDAQLINDLCGAGPHSINREQFAALRAEFLDLCAHSSKGPSAMRLTLSLIHI